MATILVVENIPFFQFALKRILEDEGYTVLPARTESQARELFRVYGPTLDAILMTWELPGTTKDLILEIVESGFAKSKPLIAYGANKESQDKQEELGCNYLLSKNCGNTETVAFFKKVVPLKIDLEVIS